jgi:hypothetical protein
MDAQLGEAKLGVAVFTRIASSGSMVQQSNLLIVTNSLDGSADTLCGLAAEQEQTVFRFNTDMVGSYSLRVSPQDFIIEDPTGRVVRRRDVTCCLWRKPWLGGEDHLAPFPLEERTWVDAQFRTLVREVVNLCRLDGHLRLVENDAARRADKLTQMSVAAKYFKVPKWEYVFRKPPGEGRRITKPLSAELISADNQKRFVYSTIVQAEHLAPGYPWLVQDLARGSHDTTVVFLAGECFHFEVARRRTEAVVDWRVNINTETPDRWNRLDLSSDVCEKIRALMGEFGLMYGRLDFIRDDEGELEFLEVNANGQFGWLDDDSLWLHRKFFSAVLDPRNTIRSKPCDSASHPV